MENLIDKKNETCRIRLNEDVPASAARTLFQQERIEGNLDNPATGQIIELYRL